jgi:hypothetical protein
VLLFSKKSPPPSPAPEPLPTRPRRNKTTPTDERHLNGTLTLVLAGVRKWAAKQGYIVERQTQLHVQLRDGVPSNGSECVTNRTTTGCFLDTDDAAYFDSPPLPALTSSDDSVIDVVSRQ